MTRTNRIRRRLAYIYYRCQFDCQPYCQSAVRSKAGCESRRIALTSCCPHPAYALKENQACHECYDFIKSRPNNGCAKHKHFFITQARQKY